MKASCARFSSPCDGTAVYLTEDELKVGFTLESLDSPDPFVDTTVVPEGIKDAIM